MITAITIWVIGYLFTMGFEAQSQRELVFRAFAAIGTWPLMLPTLLGK